MKYKEKEGMRRPPWRPRKFAHPEQLAEQFVSYAHYMEDNPLVLPKVFRTDDGGVIHAELRRPRPMTIESFSIFLGIAPRTWRYWKSNREDLAEMIELIEGLIFDHLFCLAAANMLKANLISRKLGLAHK
jgi:hypothetical protein